ncbi:MAG: hypothetical protein ABFD83_12380 [Armatimonadota bacterium]
MKIGNTPHFYMNTQNVSVNRQSSNIQLKLKACSDDCSASNLTDDEDTFVMSDGAMVHIADNIAGSEGVGDGSGYDNMADFLRSNLENTLGCSVGSISVDDLEVAAYKSSVNTKLADVREYAQGNSVGYTVNKSEAEVSTRHIEVTGSVVTQDGKEMEFSLTLDLESEVGSSSQTRYYAYGSAAKNLPTAMFDGVSRELHSTDFKFDAYPDGKNAVKGKGTFCLKKESDSKAGGNFRRVNVLV